jgi:NADPH:quinone reductase-like Zn-dependent oxidoreductase
LTEVERPALTDDGVLVRVRAAALNRLDWYWLTGAPWIARPDTGFFRPRSPLLGVDFAGTVEAVGSEAEGFKPGDEVFGERQGALAEYLCASAAVALKPANISFEQAAATPLGGLTALQGLRDKGNVQPGQRVLIQGASGGVGTFAVQIAKWLGAEVTAVCSTPNVEQARSLGADHVIDYTREILTRGDRRYDVVRQRRHPLVEGPGGCSSRMPRSSSSAAPGRTACSGRSATWSGRSSAACGAARRRSSRWPSRTGRT